METNTIFASDITKLLAENPTFQKIYQYCIAHFSKDDSQIRNFLRFTHLHFSLEEFISRIFNDCNHTFPIEVIDYQCGQAMGTLTLLDYWANNNQQQNIKNIVLVDIGEDIKRGELLVNNFCKGLTIAPTIKIVHKTLCNIEKDDIVTENNTIKIHLFFNCFDASQSTYQVYESLPKRIGTYLKGSNYFVVVNRYKKYYNNPLVYDFPVLLSTHLKHKFYSFLHSTKYMSKKAELYDVYNQKMEICDIKALEATSIIRLDFE